MKRYLALAIVLIMLLMNVPLTGDAEAEPVNMTKFLNGSESVEMTFGSGGGHDLNTKVDFWSNSQVYSATMKVMGMDDGSGNYPENVKVNFGDNNDQEWRFDGTAYGGLGQQYMFGDQSTEKTVMISNGYNDALSVWLPKNATVTEASLNVAYKAINNYGLRMGPDSGGAPICPYVYSSEYSGGSYKPRLRVTAGSTYYDYSVNDAMIKTGTGTNYGTNSYLLSYTTGDACYISFPFSNMPPVESITKVELGLYFYYAQSRKITPAIWWVTGGTWSEATITGLNAPAYEPEPVAKMDLSSLSNSVTLVYEEITPLVLGWLGAKPTSPKIDFGNDLNYEWSHSGEFTGDVITPNFATKLNAYLSTAPVTKHDQYGNDMVEVPVNITSAVGGALEVSDMEIKYVYEAEVDKNPGNAKSLKGELNKLIPDMDGKNATIVINCSSSNAGKLKLYDLDISYEPPNFAPTYNKLPYVEVAEDTTRPHLIDLSAYFNDDRTDPDDLDYRVVTVESEQADDEQLEALKEAVTIVDDVYLGFDMTVSDKLQDWFGGVNVTLKAKDDGLDGKDWIKATTTDPVFIPVIAVNDEPVPGKIIGNGFMAMNEGESDETIDLLSQFYFVDVDNYQSMLTYDVAVDPFNEVEDEELTAELMDYAGTRLTIRLESPGDWSGEDIPVYVFCDDDPVMNTTKDGDGNYVAQIVYVSILEINDEPTFEPVATLFTEEDVDVEDWFNVRSIAYDIETDVDDLAFSFDPKKEKTTYSNSRLQLTIGGDDFIDVDVKDDQFGTSIVSLYADDGDDVNETSLKIVITPMDDVPTITLDRPADAATVSGMADITGLANDIEGELESVELRIDTGGWLKIGDQQVYVYSWDTTTVINGPHKLTVRCSDQTNTSEEVSIQVHVNNVLAFNQPPIAKIDSHSDGQTVKGKVNLKGNAVDLDGVDTIVHVQLAVDGGGWEQTSYDRTEASFLWTYDWDTTKLEDGTYTITVRAFDGLDNSEEVTITLNVDNSGDGDTLPDDKKSGGEDDGNSWVLPVVIAVVVVVALVVALLFMQQSSAKKKKLEEEEARQKEEEERLAASSPVLTPSVESLPMAGAGGGLPMAGAGGGLPMAGGAAPQPTLYQAHSPAVTPANPYSAPPPPPVPGYQTAPPDYYGAAPAPPPVPPYGGAPAPPPVPGAMAPAPPPVGAMGPGAAAPPSMLPPAPPQPGTGTLPPFQ